MAQHLLQIRIEPSLKQKLQRIAMSKGLNVTSYIKMTLIDATEKDADLSLTENGFTVREEKRLRKSLEEGNKEYKKGTLKLYRSAKEALQNLEE